MKVYVYSQPTFDEYCQNNNLNDSNVENLNDEAFISIIGTKQVNEDYLNEYDIKHYFNENHANVLNLEFDDVSEDREWNGIHIKAMTEEQAKECVEFIERNLGKNFKIHCRAGVSRSQALGYFIRTCYEEYENAEENPDNPHITHNVGVLAMLKRELYKRKGWKID